MCLRLAIPAATPQSGPVVVTMTAGSSGKLSDEEQPLLEEHVVECEDSAALAPHPTLLQVGMGGKKYRKAGCQGSGDVKQGRPFRRRRQQSNGAPPRPHMNLPCPFCTWVTLPLAAGWHVSQPRPSHHRCKHGRCTPA